MLKIELVPGNLPSLKRSLSAKPPRTCAGAKERKNRITSVLEASLLALDELRLPLDLAESSPLSDKLQNSSNKCSKTQLADICCRSLDALEVLEKLSGMPPFEVEKRQCNSILKFISANLIDISFQRILHLRHRLLIYLCPSKGGKFPDASDENILVFLPRGSLSAPLVNLVVMYHLLVLKCCAKAKDQSRLPIPLKSIIAGLESPNGPLSWCNRLDQYLSKEKRKIMSDIIWTLHNLSLTESSLDLCFLAFEISPDKGKISSCLLDVLRSKWSDGSILVPLLYGIQASKTQTVCSSLKSLPSIACRFYIFAACLALEVGKTEDSEKWLALYESTEKASISGIAKNFSVIVDISRVCQKATSPAWQKIIERFYTALDCADLSQEDCLRSNLSRGTDVRDLNGAIKTLLSGVTPDLHIAGKVVLLALSEYLHLFQADPKLLTPQQIREIFSSCGVFLKKSGFEDDTLTTRILERCETLLNYNKDNEASNILSNLYFNFGVSLWNRKSHNQAISAWTRSVDAHLDICSDVHAVKKLEKLAFGYSAINQHAKSNDCLKSAIICVLNRPDPNNHKNKISDIELKECDGLLIRYLANLRSLSSNEWSCDDLISDCQADLQLKILYRLFQLNTNGKVSENNSHLTDFLIRNILHLLVPHNGFLLGARISALLLWNDQFINPDLREELNRKCRDYLLTDDCDSDCKDPVQLHHSIVYCASAMYIGMLKFISENSSLHLIKKAINCLRKLSRLSASRNSQSIYDIFPDFFNWFTVFCTFLEKNDLQLELVESMSFLKDLQVQNDPVIQFTQDFCTTVIEVTEPHFPCHRHEGTMAKPSFEMTIWAFLARTESMLRAGKLEKAIHEFSVLYPDLDKMKIPNTITAKSFGIVARRYMTKAYACRVLSYLSQKKGNLSLSTTAAKLAYRLYLKISFPKTATASSEQDGRHVIFHSQSDLVSWSAFQGIFSSLIQLGDIYSSCGSVREAQYYYTEALTVAERNYSHLKVVFACTRLHATYLCAHYIDKAEDIIKRLDFDDVVVSGRPLLSLIYLCHGLHNTYCQRYEAGLTFYRKALNSQPQSESIESLSLNVSVGLSTPDDSKLNSILMTVASERRAIKLHILLGMAESLLHQENLGRARLVLEEAGHLSCYSEDEGYLNMLYSALTFQEANKILIADPLYNVIHESALSYPNAIASPTSSKQIRQRKETRQKSTTTKRLANKHGNTNVVLIINRACDLLSDSFPNVCQYTPSYIGKRLASTVSRLCGLRSSLSVNTGALEMISTIYTEELCRAPSLVKELKWNDKRMLERVVNCELGPDCQLEMRVKDFRRLYAHLIPKDWLVVSISYCKVTQNLVLTRFNNLDDPFVLRLPLNRQSSRDPDESDFLFDEVSAMFRELIATSNQTTHMAKTSKISIDKKAWWKERYDLDANLAELLKSMEMLWFGGFTGIFDAWLPSDDACLQQFQAIMCNILSKHLTSRSDSRTKGNKGKRISIDPRVFQLFLAFGRPDKQVNQEAYSDALEDLVYFVLDILQFHGEYNAYDELDIDEVIVEMSGAIEAFYQEKAIESRLLPLKHIVLIMDKSVHSFPWESMPCLRKSSVSRMPSIESLCDILKSHKFMKNSGAYRVDSSGYFVLNPGEDLAKTQSTFKPVLKSLQSMHGPERWSGVIGSTPSPDELKEKVESSSMYLYFGHGGGEHYLGSSVLKRMDKCAAAFLFGCSSGALKDAGEFDPWGTPLAYLCAGSPTIVANLWDVTDKDIDRFSLATFMRWGLIPSSQDDDNNVNRISNGIQDLHISDDHQQPKVTITEAVAQSRDDCVLPYLNGAAPVVYGIPLVLID